MVVKDKKRTTDDKLSLRLASLLCGRASRAAADIDIEVDGEGPEVFHLASAGGLL